MSLNYLVKHKYLKTKNINNICKFLTESTGDTNVKIVKIQRKYGQSTIV